MGDVIQIRDLQAARERAHRRACDHQSIERALGLMRENLAWAAEQLRRAPIDAHPELLDRIEKLAEMIRYGMMMLGEPSTSTADDDSKRRG
ncbi:MAG: hypothetical protein JOZ29_12590 [Deltaproteobacteria bacterium]|nr:hypothetical protein [Deltaproteobacteria bacterium]